jgi:hypothetical protein
MILAPISHPPASPPEAKGHGRARPRLASWQFTITGGGETVSTASTWTTTELPEASWQPKKAETEPVAPWPGNRLPRAYFPAPVLKVVPRVSGGNTVTKSRPEAPRPQRHRHNPKLFRSRRALKKPDRSAEAAFQKAPCSKSPLSDRVLRYGMGALAALGCVFVPSLMRPPSQAVVNPLAKTIDVAARDLTASRRALDSFLSAETIPDLLEYIREANKFAPNVGPWLKARGQSLPLGGRIIGKGSKVHLKGHNIMEFILQRSEVETTPIAVMETPAGWLVDWNSYIQQGDMSVAEFLEQRPTEPVMLMVLAQPDSYFNFDFANAGQSHCLKLMDASYANTFYGYADKSNPKAALSMNLSATGSSAIRRPIPLAIRARFISAATSPAQAEITEVLQDGWFDQ